MNIKLAYVVVLLYDIFANICCSISLGPPTCYENNDIKPKKKKKQDGESLSNIIGRDIGNVNSITYGIRITYMLSCVKWMEKCING